MEDSVDLRAVGERIDALLVASAAHGAVARERAEELVRLVTDLYGAGLERLLEILHDAGRLDAGVLTEIADDDVVASLLLVHGLHPYDLPTRVERGLQAVRPELRTQGVDVELVTVDDTGAVRLRLVGPVLSQHSSTRTPGARTCTTQLHSISLPSMSLTFMVTL